MNESNCGNTRTVAAWKNLIRKCEQISDSCSYITMHTLHGFVLRSMCFNHCAFHPFERNEWTNQNEKKKTTTKRNVKWKKNFFIHGNEYETFIFRFWQAKRRKKRFFIYWVVWLCVGFAATAIANKVFHEMHARDWITVAMSVVCALIKGARLWWC